MTTEAEVLEVLLGQKVFDGRLWHVYDAGGTELTTLDGAQWHGGTHGAILWGQPASTFGAGGAGLMPELRRRRRMPYP